MERRVEGETRLFKTHLLSDRSEALLGNAATSFTSCRNVAAVHLHGPTTFLREWRACLQKNGGAGNPESVVPESKIRMGVCR